MVAVDTYCIGSPTGWVPERLRSLQRTSGLRLLVYNAAPSSVPNCTKFDSRHDKWYCKAKQI